MTPNPAEQAFAMLRAEIAAGRAEQRNTAAAYDLTLGHMAKHLAELTARVIAIEGKPALAFTPGSFGSGLGSIVQAQARLAAEGVLDAAEAVRLQATTLQGMVGRVTSRTSWRRRVAGGVALGLVAGVLLCFGAVAAFPVTRTAVSIALSEPWDAGQALMRESHPDLFERMVRLYRACPADNPVDLCEATIIIGRIPPVTVKAGKSR